jgi:hypothetical protein
MSSEPASDPTQSAQPSQPGPEPQALDTRRCWICHEEVSPTYEELSTLDKFRGKRPRKIYYSEDGGRLISPCLCKGTIKYVHEQCLQDWRYTQPGSQNHYRCRTCQYEYKLERMDWAHRVRSPVAAFGLAVGIVIVCIFLLGFVADPILNLWLDPVGTIAEGVGYAEADHDEAYGLADLDEETWSFHFLKGLLSLGLLGFVKAFLAMSPWQWWNLRTSGLVGGGRRGGTGRDRMENISMTMVVIGAVTFFWVSATFAGNRSVPC